MCPSRATARKRGLQAKNRPKRALPSMLCDRLVAQVVTSDCTSTSDSGSTRVKTFPDDRICLSLVRKAGPVSHVEKTSWSAGSDRVA